MPTAPATELEAGQQHKIRIYSESVILMKLNKVDGLPHYQEK